MTNRYRLGVAKKLQFLMKFIAELECDSLHAYLVNRICEYNVSSQD